MPKLPRISGIQAVQAFQRAGWELARQRGSHVILTKPESIYTLSVPLKPVLGPGILRDLIGKAGLTVEEFRLQLFGEMRFEHKGRSRRVACHRHRVIRRSRLHK